MTASTETCVTLLSLEQQTDLLRRFNTQYWGGRIVRQWFDDFDATSDHVQLLEDLEVVYFDFGGIPASLNFWWRALTGEIEPASIGREWRTREIEQLGLRENCSTGDYGIRRVRINLLANREGQPGDHHLSIDNIRREQGRKGLPHVEIVAALALNQDIVRKLMNGVQFPFPCLGGLEPFARYIPSIEYGDDVERFRMEINLVRFWAAKPSQQRSIPTFA